MKRVRGRRVRGGKAGREAGEVRAEVGIVGREGKEREVDVLQGGK